MKKIALLLALAANALASESLPPFVYPGTVPASSWSAKWIGAKPGADTKKQNLWTAYRKEFDLAAKPEKAVARIAVDSKYWLWVNGELAVREGALKRGPTPTDTFFDEVDLAPHLKQGKNTVAILVWYFGKQGFSHKSSGKSGLLFQMEAGAEKVVSDSSWRAVVHPAYSDTDAPHPNNRLPESNIRYDAGKEFAGWERPGFDASAWAAAEELGAPDCAPWGRLVKRPMPLWKDYGLKPYTNAPTLPAVSDGQLIKGKLPYNAQVTPYLKIDAKAGQTIKIQMDNYRGGSEPNVRAEYVTRDGEQEFEFPGWMNGHEVHYEIPAGIKILDLKYRETGFDTEFAEEFSCDDDFMNRLRTKALRTLYITMRDTYMDCPDRERALWWGDAVNELGEAFYAFDRRSDLLARKCIFDLIAWQKPDGILFSPVPTGNWDKDLPLQMLASIGSTGFWTYSFFSGDMETLATVYPGMKRYMEIWDMQPDGLVVPRRGAWEWGDWGANIDMPILYNAWYYIGLQGLRNAAIELGKDADLPWIDARMKSIETAFNKTFWTGTEYRSPGYGGQTDDRANAMAVIAGFAKPDQYPALLEVFRKQAHASPYMEKYVLEALCIMDEPEFAQERIKQRFAKMVNHPEYTTLWEGWGIGAEGFGGGTINHAWSGGPLTIMSQYFAGIAPTAPAFSKYSVFPQMGSLGKINTKVVTTKGDISLQLSKTKDSFAMELTSPAGTQATVRIPVPKRGKITEVKAKGQVVWSDGKPCAVVPGLRFVEATPRYVVFAVDPGKWSFSAAVEQLAAASPSAPAEFPLTLADIRVRDPFILPEGGMYYLYAQGGNRAHNDNGDFGVEVYKSRDLVHWSQPKQVFVRPKEGFWGNPPIWAPEVHKLDGAYYMFATFAGRAGGRGSQILRSESPEGPFVVVGDEANTPAEQTALDATPFIDPDGTHWMVYAHEWAQIKDGTYLAVKMKNDWSARIGDPVLLFAASQGPWVRPHPRADTYVTDGPFFHRMKNGKLVMIWSSFVKGHGYGMGQAISESGTIAGPWRHVEKPFFGGDGEDGGHAMIFRDFSGELLMALHQPNGGNCERAKIFRLKEDGDQLVVDGPWTPKAEPNADAKPHRLRMEVVCSLPTPVIGKDTPGMDSIPGGFEGGSSVKVMVNGKPEYHLFAHGYPRLDWSQSRLEHWVSPDGANFRRASVLLENFRDEKAGMNHIFCSPVPFYDEKSERWNLIFCEFVAESSWTGDSATIWRAQSKTPGKEGIGGPYDFENRSVFVPKHCAKIGKVTPLATACSAPFQVQDGRWAVFVSTDFVIKDEKTGARRQQKWPVMLNFAASLLGPFEPPKEAVVPPLIEPTAYVENPMPIKVRGPKTGRDYWVSVYDFLAPEVTSFSPKNVFGFSWSADGVNWPTENGQTVNIDDGLKSGERGWWRGAWSVRTPHQMIDEGDGTYSIYFTGGSAEHHFSGMRPFGKVTVRLVEEEIPAKPAQ